MTAPKKYLLFEKEVLMFGDHVGIAWNVEYETKTIRGEDGIKYKAEIPLRDGDPYIDFISIREDESEDKDSHNRFYEDEDSPAVGGLSLNNAIKLHFELGQALAYYKARLEKKHD